MKDPFSITYYDRATGSMMAEKVHAARFLRWLYNTGTGVLACRLLTSNRLFSAAYGRFHDSGISKLKIKPFVKRMKINMAESLKQIDDFVSFNDFFTRKIHLSARPIDERPGACIAPADGKVLVYEKIDADTTFRIKRCTFNLRDFLKDDVLARMYSGGSVLISRLSLADYHHFHFPDSGVAHQARPIRGNYHAGASYSRTRLLPFFTENYRMQTLLSSDHFGWIVMVEVGALTVGSISQSYEPGKRVSKGDHKGNFELGGSTVVLLFEKGSIRFCKDLLDNTENEIETSVRFGDCVGYSVQSRGNRRVET